MSKGTLLNIIEAAADSKVDRTIARASAEWLTTGAD